MKIGMDLDGTLDRPEVLALSNALFDAGHEVHVITAYQPTGGYTIEMKFEKLKRLGARYTKVHFAEGDTMNDIGYTKARIIERENIPIMFDDMPVFVMEMKKNSTAAILLVV